MCTGQQRGNQGSAAVDGIPKQPMKQLSAQQRPAGQAGPRKRYVAPMPRKKAPPTPPDNSAALSLVEQAAIAADVLNRERAYRVNAPQPSNAAMATASAKQRQPTQMMPPQDRGPVQQATAAYPAPSARQRRVQPNAVEHRLPETTSTAGAADATEMVYMHNQVPGLANWLPPQQQVALMKRASPPIPAELPATETDQQTSPYAYVPLPPAPVPWPVQALKAEAFMDPDQAPQIQETAANMCSCSHEAHAANQVALSMESLAQSAGTAANRPVDPHRPEVAAHGQISSQQPDMPSLGASGICNEAAPMPQRTAVRIVGPHVRDTCPFATDVTE